MPFSHMKKSVCYLFQTISRASTKSRKSRTTSSGSDAFDRGQSSDSDSEGEEPRQSRVGFEHDFHVVDITDEKAFDTDLEVEGNKYKGPH